MGAYLNYRAKPSCDHPSFPPVDFLHSEKFRLESLGSDRNPTAIYVTRLFRCIPLWSLGEGIGIRHCDDSTIFFYCALKYEI